MKHLIAETPAPALHPAAPPLWLHFNLIQSRHQRILQGVGNRHAQQRPGQHVLHGFSPEQVGLQQHLGQLFDIERHPVRLGDDVLHDFIWQCLAACQVRDQRLDLRALQAIEGNRGHMRTGRPGRLELLAECQHVQHRHRGRLLQDQTQHFQRRRIGPVQVFPHGQRRLSFGFLQQPTHQRILGLLPLLLRGHVQGCIASLWHRHREQGGKQGHHFF